LLPKTSSSQPTTPLSLLFLMRTDMNTSYSRIDLSCRHSLSLTYLIDIIFVCHNPFSLSFFRLLNVLHQKRRNSTPPPQPS
jgi:hypothetical protein